MNKVKLSIEIDAKQADTLKMINQYIESDVLRERLLQAVELYISTFTDEDGNVDLRPAMLQPGPAQIQAWENEKKAGSQTKRPEPMQCYVLSATTVYGNKYYRLWVPYYNNIIKAPEKCVVMEETR